MKVAENEVKSAVPEESLERDLARALNFMGVRVDRPSLRFAGVIVFAAGVLGLIYTNGVVLQLSSAIYAGMGAVLLIRASQIEQAHDAEVARHVKR
jgi:hypothetical protein